MKYGYWLASAVVAAFLLVNTPPASAGDMTWIITDRCTNQHEIRLIPSDFVVHSFRPPMEEAMRRLWSQLG